MPDPTDWVPVYFDTLERNTTLERGLSDALTLIEDLLADPFLSYGVATKRLSEWQEDWDDWAAPLIEAITGDPLALRPPWWKIAEQVRQERASQSIHVPESEVTMPQLSLVDAYSGEVPLPASHAVMEAIRRWHAFGRPRLCLALRSPDDPMPNWDTDYITDIPAHLAAHPQDVARILSLLPMPED